MENVRVAMRYAKALFPVANEQGEAEEVLNDLTNIIKLLDISTDLRLLIHSPVITQTKKKRIFEEIFKNKVTPVTYNFLQILIDKGRENLLRSIRYCYNNIYNQHNKRISCQIISARELDEKSKDNIVKFVENHTKLTAVPEYFLEADLLGGMKIKINNWVYDSTVKNKLKALKRTLVS